MVNAVAQSLADKARKVAALPINTALAKSMSMESLLQRKAEVLESNGEQELPPPILTVQFGEKNSPVPDGQQKDYGLEFHDHSSLGISWGWNCDLNKLLCGRTRAKGDDKYLKTFVIPDRHGKCPNAPAPAVWQVSIPPGDYTVKFSSTDTNEKHGATGLGCTVQGVRMGDLPAQNSCADGEDSECYILPKLTVSAGELFQIAGSHAKGCGGLNYVSFYPASEARAASLATYVPLEANTIDQSFLDSEADLEKFLEGIASENRDVIATSVNAGYIDFAMNWLCSISKMNVTNYFLFATGT